MINKVSKVLNTKFMKNVNMKHIKGLLYKIHGENVKKEIFEDLLANEIINNVKLREFQIYL